MDNIKIDYSSKTVTVRFNPNIYQIEQIKKTISVFKGLCDASIIKKSDIFVHIKPKDISIMDSIGYEFSNYILGLMKNEAVV
jgi:aromatic ring-opening dioxygenase LigB subunit